MLPCRVDRSHMSLRFLPFHKNNYLLLEKLNDGTPSCHAMPCHYIEEYPLLTLSFREVGHT